MVVDIATLIQATGNILTSTDEAKNKLEENNRKKQQAREDLNRFRKNKETNKTKTKGR